MFESIKEQLNGFNFEELNEGVDCTSTIPSVEPDDDELDVFDNDIMGGLNTQTFNDEDEDDELLDLEDDDSDDDILGNIDEEEEEDDIVDDLLSEATDNILLKHFNEDDEEIDSLIEEVFNNDILSEGCGKKKKKYNEEDELDEDLDFNLI